MSESLFKTLLVIALSISLIQTFGLLADTFITWPDDVVFSFYDVSSINWLVNWMPGVLLLILSIKLSHNHLLIKQGCLCAGALLILIGTGSWFMYEYAFALQRFFSSLVNVVLLGYVCIVVQQKKVKYVV